jgi:hypothetical protein
MYIVAVLSEEVMIALVVAFTKSSELTIGNPC